MQRRLGGPIAPARIDAASTAAIRRNPDAARCLRAAEARAVNAIWYGLTRDGSLPDPAADAGGDGSRLARGHLGWGLARGSRLLNLAGTPPSPSPRCRWRCSCRTSASCRPICPASSTRWASPLPAGSGWKRLDAATLARAFDQGLAMQATFSRISTDNPDLSASRDAGTRILSDHGWADDLIPGQGSVHHCHRAAKRMGGVEALQRFNRLDMIPGLAHDGGFSRSASLDPATGAPPSADKVPLPQGANGRDERFMALRRWVKHGEAPGRIDVRSRNGAVSVPLYPHPQQARYRGTGPETAAASYDCR